MADGDNDRNLQASFTDGAIIYNTTFQVLHSAHTDWLQWMQDVHIPEITGTGCFIKHQVVRLLETDETDGPVYAIQYYASSKEEYERYQSIYAAGFSQKEQQLWGNKVFGFSSVMQIIK